MWWISFVWLIVFFMSEWWWFVKYLTEPDNPYCYEYGIGAAYIFLYCWPAAIAMFIATLVPKTGLSTRRPADWCHTPYLLHHYALPLQGGSSST
jgi:hypothetical protein